MMKGITSIISSLIHQHAIDLYVYRAAHQQWANRVLHWILIPVETASFFLVLAIVAFHGSLWERRIRKGVVGNRTIIRQSSNGSSRPNLKKRHEITPQQHSLVIDLLSSIGWILGILSFVLCLLDDGNVTLHQAAWIIGIIAAAFHLALVPYSLAIITQWGSHVACLVAMVAWTLAWSLQVGIGHYLIEGNQPTIANKDQVSALAMVTSIVIAWKS